MKGSRKTPAPAPLSDWAVRTENWTPTYPGMPGEVREAVRSALFLEQRGLCVYCGRRLEMEKMQRTHIEHFRPQSLYRDQDIEFANLYLSCGSKDLIGKPSQTCGNFKEGWFDEHKYVAPLYPDCVQRFKFLLTGWVEISGADDDAALEMIKRLNLNHPELVKEREEILFFLDQGETSLDDFWDETTQTSESLGHVAYHYFGQILP